MKFFYVFILTMLFSFSATAGVSFDAGVSVNEEGKTSVEAKNTAMNKAHREAFLKVGARLTSAENVKILNELTDEQILHFIREVEIVAEKSTSVSYMADLNIKINESLLRQYMAENNLIEGQDLPTKVLIIPVFSDTDYKDNVLFEDGNVWRNAWLEKGQIKSGAFDFEVLKDTPENKEKITSEKAGRFDKKLYEDLRVINGVENMFILNAIRAGENTLVLTIKSYPKQNQKSLIVNGENSFDKAIEQSVSYITAFMQNKINTQVSAQGKLEIIADFSLKDWLDAEKRLNKVLSIKKVEIKSFAVQRIVFSIEYSGDFNNLITALAQNGLYLQNIDGYNVLTK